MKRFALLLPVLAVVVLLAPAQAQGKKEVTLDFNDGLLPSAHGWTFQGQDPAQNPITESQVASVSGGVLVLDTATPYGVGSDETLAFWQRPVAPVDPTNYVLEVRMRAFEPNSARAFCGGFLGALASVDGDFRVEITLMPSQVTFHGAPGATCSTEIYVPADGGNFHTYTAEVRNGQLSGFVDGVLVVTGTMNVPTTASVIRLGDASTSGGNVRAEIDFIRAASLKKAKK